MRFWPFVYLVSWSDGGAGDSVRRNLRRENSTSKRWDVKESVERMQVSSGFQLDNVVDSLIAERTVREMETGLTFR